MKLKDIKIDWTNFNVLTLESKQEVFFSNTEFGAGYTEISPGEYLQWAKLELEKGKDISPSSLVEIISNVKRCIDCKCETFLKTYGFKKEINKKNYPYLVELIKKDSVTFLSLISYLLNLNLIMVNEIRNLRNKIEHNYIKPTLEEAQRAIDLGELFLLAFHHKENCIRYYCEISDRKNDDEFYILLYRGGEEDQFYGDTLIQIRDGKGINDNTLSVNDKEYTKLLKILINGTFLELPKLFEGKTPDKFIKYSEYWDEEVMSIENNDDVIF